MTTPQRPLPSVEEIAVSTNHGLLQAANRFGTQAQSETARWRIGVLNRQAREARAGDQDPPPANPEMGQGDRGSSSAPLQGKAAGLAEAQRRGFLTKPDPDTDDTRRHGAAAGPRGNHGAEEAHRRFGQAGR